MLLLLRLLPRTAGTFDVGCAGGSILDRTRSLHARWLRPLTGFDRLQLAIGRFFVSHEGGSPSCAHVFVEPLSWMRSELERAQLAGRLSCPKCSAQVGRYAWQGIQCSCRQWVVPGISLLRSKVDERRCQPAHAHLTAIRLPPALPASDPPVPDRR